MKIIAPKRLMESVFPTVRNGGIFNASSLDLQFARTKTLDPRVTFTRASSGTYVDSQGVIRTATTNLLLRSEEFDNAYWSKTNSTVTANATTAPNGTLTAEKLITNSGASGGRVNVSITATADTPVTLSCYAKQGETNIFSLFISDGITGRTAVFNLTTGTVSGTPTTGMTASIQPVGDGWYRCVATVAGASLSGTTRSLRIVQNVVANDGTSGLFIWGAQLEQSSTVGEYIPTTSTINSAPRFDHNPTTRESLGLLVEEQRTNLLLHSACDSNWPTGGFGTATYNLGLSALGVFSGVQVASSGQNWHSIYRTGINLTASTVYAFILFYRAGTSGRVRLTFRNNSTATETVVNGLAGNLSVSAQFAGSAAILSQYLCSDGLTYVVTGTYTPNGTSVDHWFRIGPDSTVSGQTVIALGGQLEAGAFPTSYIPTTTATVTRSADVASITGTNFSSWYRQDEGTVFNSVIPRGSSVAYSTLSDDTSSNRFQLYAESNGILLRTSASGSAANNSIGSQAVGVPLAVAYAYGSGATAASLNGAAVTSTTQALPTTNSVLGIGQYFASTSLNSICIRRLTYWPTRLPNSTLQQITQ